VTGWTKLWEMISVLGTRPVVRARGANRPMPAPHHLGELHLKRARWGVCELKGQATKGLAGERCNTLRHHTLIRVFRVQGAFTGLQHRGRSEEIPVIYNSSGSVVRYLDVERDILRPEAAPLDEQTEDQERGYGQSRVGCPMHTTTVPTQTIRNGPMPEAMVLGRHRAASALVAERARRSSDTWSTDSVDLGGDGRDRA
jgi:hypothetical protein